jgi:glycosyltransferase involved in cell wall biosynthesis
VPNGDKPAYQIIHIFLEQPLMPVSVPEGYSGLAFVIHHETFPVAFFMEALPAGSVLTSRDLAARIMPNVRTHILREQIYHELEKTPSQDLRTLDIAICTHNRSDLLSRCIQSLVIAGADQSSASTRILVIDNAPTDNRTMELVAGFSNVTYIREPIPGLNFARNRALRESSAELIGFVDDDSTVDRSWLQAIREAWATNPNAAAFVGPVLPLELETKAQVLFEQMGGFGRHFEPMRFGPILPESPTFPYSAASMGTGCNMFFSRQLLLDLGGFDEALDTGDPLPGGGDMDMLYRVVRASHALVREPRMVVYHQHRREYGQLRYQMWTWGLTTMAYITKCYRHDPSQRSKIRKWIAWWFAYHVSKILAPYLRGDRTRWPFDLVVAQLAGGVLGLLGEYDRSLRRVAARRRQYT